MRILIVFFVFISIGLGLAPARAVPVAAIDVPNITAAAELIVVGRVENLRILRDTTPSASFSVKVDRVLKGSTGSTNHVLVRLDLSSEGHSGVAERQYALFFLHKAGAFYSAVDPSHASLVASPLPRPMANGTVDALSAVSSELTAVLTTPAAVLLDKTTGVQDLVVGEPSFQLEHVYYEAAKALGTIPYDVARDALASVTPSASLSAQLWALTSLFQMAESAELKARRVEVLKVVSPILMNPAPELDFSVMMLANAMESRISTPTAVHTLAGLLQSSSVIIRRAAAATLGEMATKDVIIPLGRIALNDRDQEVRYFAVIGLAAATERGERPALDLYRSQEEALLRNWRAFASSYRE